MGSSALQHQLEAAEKDAKEAKAELRKVGLLISHLPPCAHSKLATCCLAAGQPSCKTEAACCHNCVMQPVDGSYRSCRTASIRVVGICLQAHESAQHVQADQKAQWQSTLQAKDAEIQDLLSDRDRLEAALATIKGQMTSVASPAATVQPTAPQQKSLVRASVDSATLRQAQNALPCSCYDCSLAVNVSFFNVKMHGPISPLDVRALC